MKKLLQALLAFCLITACGDHEDIVADPVAPVENDTLFVVIEGGTFITSTGDTTEIETFEIGRFEVTNRLYYWLAFKNGIDLPPDPGFPGMEFYLFDFPDYPVVNVSAGEAGAAAAAIGCRLPTPAEWEYAASRGLSGNIHSLYPWGLLDPPDAEYPANYLAGDDWETRAVDGFAATAPVGSYPLSDAGIADMAGNVAEWTYPMFSICIVKGGSWVTPAENLTIGSSLDIQPGDRSWHTGFRLVR